MDGVWAAASSNMQTYLLLKERAKAFRSDPEVQAALKASQVDELSVPTLAAGESAAQLRSDVSAYENYDVEPAATKGYGMVHLDQLAIEHILGAR
jgi:xylose isomerase